MQRVLIVAAVMLALIVGGLLWQRGGKPSAETRPAVASAPIAPAPAPAPVAEPAKPAEPATPVEQAKPVVAAKPAAAAPAPAPAKPAAQPAKAPAAKAAVTAAPARPAAQAAPPAAPAAPEPLRTDLPGAVAGLVLDAKGGPIADTTVVALSADGEEAFETVTGDDGSYLMAAMKPGRYVLFPGLGTPVSARVGGQAVEIQHGQVRRYDLVEPIAGSTVRVRPLRADGLPAAAQVVLVRGRVASPASLPALLSGEAILLPDAAAQGNVLRRVPAGVYTLVILQGEGAPPRVVREQVTIRGEGEQQVDVRVPGDLVAAWSPSAG